MAEGGTSEVREALREHPTLAELRLHGPLALAPEAIVARIAPLIEVRTYADGEQIFRQGDRDVRVFMLDEGRVRFTVPLHDAERTVTEVAARTAFGELAWFGDGTRSASAWAVGPVRVFVGDPDRVETDPAAMLIMMRALASIAAERLRASTAREVEEADTRERFGKLTILVMVVMSMMTCIAGLSRSESQPDGLPLYLVAPAIMISMIWIAVAAVRVTQRPAATFGLTLAGSGRALAEGALVSAAMIGIYLAIGQWMPLGEIVERMSIDGRWFAYIVVAVLQELFCRGILQTSFQTFYKDERGVVSVLLASLVYGVSHAYIGAGITAATFVMGILLGFLYIRHRNLLGVVLVHYIGGCLAMGVGLLAS